MHNPECGKQYDGNTVRDFVRPLPDDLCHCGVCLHSHPEPVLLGVSERTPDHHRQSRPALPVPGLAMNLIIDTQLHTVPLRSLIPVLERESPERAPLFVPAEDVAPD